MISPVNFIVEIEMSFSLEEITKLKVLAMKLNKPVEQCARDIINEQTERMLQQLAQDEQEDLDAIINKNPAA